MQLETKSAGVTAIPDAAPEECCKGVEAIEAVAACYGIEPRALRSRQRGPVHVAAARQVAMYIAHVTCALTMKEVGQLLNRDRTTVAHACRIVEDGRDSPQFDSFMERLEIDVRCRRAAAV